MRSTHPAHSTPSGFTLIELIVVIAILGIVTIIAGVSMHTAAPVVPQDPSLTEIKILRDSALESGQTVTAVIKTDDQTATATAYPDGSVLSSLRNVERTTGRPYRSVNAEP